MALRLVPVALEDFEDLLVLRIAAMRESLERAGIFDPVRARERFLSQFDPSTSWHLEDEYGGRAQRVGLLTLQPQPDALRVMHLYVHPDHQGRGVGAWALTQARERARELRLDLTLAALKTSDANRFYRRHGFEIVGENELDVEYRWPHGAHA